LQQKTPANVTVIATNPLTQWTLWPAARSVVPLSVSLTGGQITMAKYLILFVLVLIVGGAAFLATWNMPPPTATVEKVIPNDRFK